MFELGYRNTVFSYVQSAKVLKYGFLAEMKRFLQEYVPDYDKNHYYESYMDPENKKLIRMHMQSTWLFMIYYQLLKTYRSVRYGKSTN